DRFARGLLSGVALRQSANFNSSSGSAVVTLVCPDFGIVGLVDFNTARTNLDFVSRHFGAVAEGVNVAISPVTPDANGGAAFSLDAGKLAQGGVVAYSIDQGTAVLMAQIDEPDEPVQATGYLETQTPGVFDIHSLTGTYNVGSIAAGSGFF